MTSSVVVLFLIGAVVLLAVGQTDAIECYVCGLSFACNDNPDLAHTDVTTLTGCQSCSKIKINRFVTRECLLTAHAESCSEIDLLSTHTCYCSTNLCNSASHVTVSMAIALVLAFVAMLFRF
ncbi:hypothetical protein MAR_004937 [Mya arenaria]|uniref:Uncharacterized protein n=1 Tax=Mya arenaria TaxID=6604 RepID=A0ABY7F163_MYAAR|nr:uncharacterized protein LOC128203604 [Mya arenaria]WAR14832.1 hypothetical protein MAR_004937 [Mya arenaria]